jgi:hypothetical protein
VPIEEEKEEEPFKTYWLRGAPASLTLKSCTFFPHSIYVFSIYLRTNSDFYPTYRQRIGFIIVFKSVYFAARNGF